jgi:hypothetical protein
VGGVILKGTVINTTYVTPYYQGKGRVFPGIYDRSFREDIFHIER